MRHESTLEITLADRGIASAYCVLPLGKFKREVERLHVAIHSHNADRRLRGKRPNIALKEVVYAFGQADLLAYFRVGDVRSMLAFDYPQDSDASVLNFILSVPCHTQGTLREKSNSMRFTMHLRLRRAVYAEDDAVTNEHGIIGYLSERLKDARCAATVHVGLGWADLIVDGSFDPTNMQRFAKFLMEVHEGCVVSDDGERHGIFQRTMTILGLHWPNHRRALRPPSLPNATPAVFVRAEPGYLQETIKRVAEKPKLEFRLIDGKSDFVAFADRPIPNFLLKNLELSSDNDPNESSGRHGIQKLETHLVFSAPELDKGLRDRTVVGRTTAPLAKRCRCLDSTTPAQVSPNLPPSLRQSIDNLLFLFHSTLHDTMSCCDVQQAIHGGKIALTRLSERVDTLHAERKLWDAEYQNASEGSAKQKEAHDHCKAIQGHLEAALRQLDVWHLLAERVLRQRTVASFDALLSQSDRSVVYRGSVQKFLFLADALMNDFAVRINPFGGTVPALFSAMGDSVSRVMSMQRMGLIRVPPRHVFTLPFIIPDLWHEVGVYWFYRHAIIEKFAIEDGNDPVLGELGDLYADLVVLRHGFFGKFNRFAFSLMRAWLDSYDRSTLSLSVDRENLEDFLCRLTFAVGMSNDGFFAKIVKSGSNAKAAVDRQYNAFRIYFQDAPELTDERREVVATRVISKLKLYGEPLKRVFEETIAQTAIDESERERWAKRLESSPGKLVSFGLADDMNMIMGELYWRFQLHQIANATGQRKGQHVTAPFRRMASSVRSAILEYHSRRSRA